MPFIPCQPSYHHHPGFPALQPGMAPLLPPLPAKRHQPCTEDLPLADPSLTGLTAHTTDMSRPLAPASHRPVPSHERSNRHHSHISAAVHLSLGDLHTTTSRGPSPNSIWQAAQCSRALHLVSHSTSHNRRASMQPIHPRQSVSQAPRDNSARNQPASQTHHPSQPWWDWFSNSSL
jgi:hypothetical protein